MYFSPDVTGDTFKELIITFYSPKRITSVKYMTFIYS